jgi:CDP-glucose 4,6-dehydratase
LEDLVPGNFWKNKKVLITGYEGFLGSNLTLKMIELGAKVTGIDRKTRRKETILTKADYKCFKSVKLDVSDYAGLNKAIKQIRPEVVFHLAAEAIVGICNFHPVQTFKANIEGTWNLLELCNQNRSFVKAVVVASSDKAYGSHKILPYTEEAPLSGNYPYDVSKSCADLISYMYHNTYKLPVVVTRCGNIFGPGDFNFSRIVPSTIKSALSGRTFFIRSDGKFTRDYVFVDDIVNGYIMLAEQLERKKLSGNAFNFSNETPMTVIDLVKKTYRLAGQPANFKVLNKAKYEIKHQYLSSKKARKTLGWKPEFSLDEALAETIKWYRDYGILF